MVAPTDRKQRAQELVNEHELSISAACRCMSLNRSLYYRAAAENRDSEVMAAIEALVESYPRWGFRKIYDKLRLEGKPWNHKRVYRIYCQLGLNKRRHFTQRIPQRPKQPTTPPSQPNGCWAMDFTSDNLNTGNSFRTLNVIEEFHREALGIEVDSSLPSERVVRTLDQIAEWRGLPQSIRLDNGPEFIAEKTIQWALCPLPI